MKDPDIRQAKAALERLSTDPDARLLAEMRERALISYHLDLSKARKEGLSFAHQLEHLLSVLVLREAIEQQRRHLTLEFAYGPTLARGLDLVERAGLGSRDAQEHEIVGPGQRRREE
jgi:hypothetical protein